MNWLYLLAIIALRLHPFYMSITQVDHRPETESLEISMKVFIDDLEKALEKQNGKPLHLCTPSEIKEADTWIQQYLKSHFKITINQIPISWQWVGKEKEDDAVWIFIEARNIKEVRYFQLTNSVLTEIFDSQNNIVHLNMYAKKKSYILSRSTPSFTTTF